MANKWYQSQFRPDFDVSPSAPTGKVGRGSIYDEEVTGLGGGKCYEQESHIEKVMGGP